MAKIAPWVIGVLTAIAVSLLSGVLISAVGAGTVQGPEAVASIVVGAACGYLVARRISSRIGSRSRR
jgi:ABC-type Co2+ transport system permease subunit